MVNVAAKLDWSDIENSIWLSPEEIDIGIVDNSSFAISPVATTSTNGSNNKYGILMTNTNGSGGLVIAYYPEAAATGTNQQTKHHSLPALPIISSFLVILLQIEYCCNTSKNEQFVRQLLVCY
jgi:hypothetical protein